MSTLPAKHQHHNSFIIILSPEIACYLMSPSEEARRVDVWVCFVLIVRHLDVVPHAVVYPGHGACGGQRTALAGDVTGSSRAEQR